MRTKSPITRVNEALARAGRAERVVRARGYYRLSGGEAHRFASSGLYELGGAVRSDPAFFEPLRGSVVDVMQENGVTVLLLKDCPFDGGAAEVDDYGGGPMRFSVVCSTCNVATPRFAFPALAVAVWNRRPS